MSYLGAGLSAPGEEGLCSSAESLRSESSLFKIGRTRDEKIKHKPACIPFPRSPSMSPELSIINPLENASLNSHRQHPQNALREIDLGLTKRRGSPSRTRHHRRAAKRFLSVVSRLALSLLDGNLGSIDLRRGSSAHKRRRAVPVLQLVSYMMPSCPIQFQKSDRAVQQYHHFSRHNSDCLLAGGDCFNLAHSRR
jgi:hypothetical protein